MFRGKETGNKITRRISAAILALVLVLTSVNVDWNVLNATADPNPTDYITIENGGLIAQKFTIDGLTGNYLDQIDFQVSAGDAVSVTAEVVQLIRGSLYSPDDGVDITNFVTIPASLTESIDYNDPKHFVFSFNHEPTNTYRDAINFAYGETVTVVVQINFTSVDTTYPVDNVRITQDTTKDNGFYKYGGKWNRTYSLMERRVVPADSIPPQNVVSVNGQTGMTDLYLAPGQVTTITPAVAPGYVRYIDYEMPGDDYEIITLDRFVNEGYARITAGKPGNTVITFLGTGVTQAPPDSQAQKLNIHVLEATSGDTLTFNNVVLAPTAGNLLINNAAAISGVIVTGDSSSIDVGRYLATVDGDAVYPGYRTTMPYEIIAKDITPATPGAASTVVTATPIASPAPSTTPSTINNGNLVLEFDHSTGTILSGKFTWAGGGTNRDFYYGSDFNAQVLSVDRTNVAKPVYSVRVEGKNNFSGSVDVYYESSLSASEIDINDIYDVSVDRPEITYDKNQTVTPSFTFTRKSPVTETLAGIPGDVSIAYKDVNGASHNLKDAGLVKVIITSKLYNGQIEKEFIIKRNIGLESNFRINLKATEQTVVAKYDGSGQFIPYTPVPEKVILDTSVSSSDPSYKELQYGNDYTVSYSHNDSVGTATVTITGAGYYTGSQSTTFRILPNIETTAEVSIGSAALATRLNGFESGYVATYTGETIKVDPSQVHIKVDDNGDGIPEILSDKYYSIESPAFVPDTAPDRNLNAGRKNGCIVITTTPAYGSQTLTVYFEIAPCKIKEATIVVEDYDKFNQATTYSGAPVVLDPAKDGFRLEVRGNNNRLLDPSEFSITGYSDDHTSAGAASLFVTAQGNYFGVAEANFNILKRSINDSDVIVTDIPAQTYDGKEQRPGVNDIKLTYKGRELKAEVRNASGTYSADTDFIIETYYDNKAITTATQKARVLIKGINNFSGDRYIEFDIAPASLFNGDIKFQLSGGISDGAIVETLSPGSTEISSSFTIQYDGGSVIPGLAVIGADGTPLVLGTDYYIATKNTVNAASASSEKAPAIYIYGKGAYSSSSEPVVIKYNISRRPVYDNVNDKTLAYMEVEYNLETGEVTAVRDKNNKDHKKLRQEVDYTVTPDPTDNGTKNGAYEGIITGIGNYTGELKYTYYRGKSIANFYVDIFSPNITPTGASWGGLNVAEGNGSTPSYYQIQYIGKNRPLIIVRDPNYKDSNNKLVNKNDAADDKDRDYSDDVAFSTSNYDIEYTVMEGSDPEGYDVGSKVKVTITGKNEYFGILTRYYSIGNARFSEKTDIAYRHDFDITLNGQTITGDKATAGYKTYEFNYTGVTQVDPVIKVMFTPKYRANAKPAGEKVYGQLPASYPMESIEIPVIANGKLNLGLAENVEGTLNIIPAPNGNFSSGGFYGEDMKPLTYKVVKTQLNDGSDPDKPTNISITGINATYPYKGVAYAKKDFTPVVTLVPENIVLKEGTDYTYNIVGNTPAGAAGSVENVTYGTVDGETTVVPGAYIEISGTGFYGGSFKVPITITPLSITDTQASITVDEIVNIDSVPDHTNNANPGVVVKYGTRTLTRAANSTATGDYYVTMVPPSGVSEADINKTVGRKTIKITGKGNYTGEVTEGYNVRKSISPANNIPTINVGGLAIDNPGGIYTGTENPIYRMYSDGKIVGLINDVVDSTKTLSANGRGSIEVELQDASKTELRYGTDYLIELKKLDKPRSTGGTIVISGIGDYYGSQEIPVAKLWGVLAQEDVSTVYSNNGEVQYTGSDVPAPEVSFNGEILSKRDDYSVKYIKEEGGAYPESNSSQNAKEIGTYKLIVTGKGIYEGSTVERIFTITPRPMNVTITLDKKTFAYDGTEQRPVVTVKDGTTVLKEGQDYNLTKPTDSTDPGRYEVTIQGTGNYDVNSGAKAEYEIIADITNKAVFTVGNTITDLLLKSDGAIKEANTAGTTDAAIEGALVTESTKITVTNQKDAGLLPVKDTDYEITVEGATRPGAKAAIVITGKGFYTGTVRFSNIPVYGLISDTQWTNKAVYYNYTGAKVDPSEDMVLTFGGSEIAKGVAYTAQVPADSIEVADYNLTVTGRKDGGFLGSADFVYNIRYDLSQATVTLAVKTTPFDNTAKTPEPTVTMPGRVTPLIRNTDYTVDYTTGTDNINVGMVKVTINPVTNKSVRNAYAEFEITKIDVTDTNWNPTVTPAISTYTGEAIEPTVLPNFTGLPSTPTFEVVYSDNINVTKGAKATITLTGNYKGTKTVTFEIQAKPLTESMISIDPANYTYTGSTIKPAYTVTDAGELVENVDFTTTLNNAVDVGTASIVFTGKGNYTGTVSRTFTIDRLDISAEGAVNISVPSREYNGKEITTSDIKKDMTVAIVAGDGSRTVLPKDAYVVSFDSGVKPQDANEDTGYVVYVTASGASGYDYITGTASTKFYITKRTLSNALLGTVYEPSISGRIESDGKYYIYPENLYNRDFSVDENLPVTVVEDDIRLFDAGINKELYKVGAGLSRQVKYEYANHDIAGVASFTFLPADNSNYTGEIVLYYRIGYDLSAGNAAVDIDRNTYQYDGEGHVPNVTKVTYGGSILSENDYAVIPGDGDPKPVNVGTYDVTVRGKGKRFYGEVKKQYEITKRSKSGLVATFADNALVNGVWYYNGTPAKPEIIVYDASLNDAVVDPNDYTVTYNRNTSIGTASYIVTMLGRSNYEPGNLDMSNYSGGINTFEIVPSELSDGDFEIRLSGSSPYSFTGRKITPGVTVLYNGKQIAASNYEVSYANNILPGTAQVTVILKGNYEGYGSVPFDIVANIQNTSSVKFTAADRRWTGQAVDSQGIKGYLVSNPVIDLIENENYTVDISPVGGNWDTALRAKAEIRAIGEGYTGTRTLYFSLIKDMSQGQDPADPGYTDPNKPDPLPDNPDNPNPPTPGNRRNLNDTGISATVVAPASGFSYNGNAFTPSIIVTDGTNTLTRGSSSSTTADYYVTYRNNVNAGTASADITGINNYQGTITRTFIIKNTGGGGTSTNINISGFSAAANGSTGANLSWGSVSGVSTYTISWRGTDGSTGSRSVTGSSTSASVTGLNPGVTYTFTITANGTNGQTGTAQARCTTQTAGSSGGGVVITPVTGLTGMSTSVGAATISWINPKDGTYYEVYRSTSPNSYGSYIGALTNGGTSRFVYLDKSSLTSGRTYYYWVRPYRYINGSKMLGSYSSNYVEITIK